MKSKTLLAFASLILSLIQITNAGYALDDYNDGNCPICFDPRVKPRRCTRSDHADQTRTKACDEGEHCYMGKLGYSRPIDSNYHRGYNAIFFCATPFEIKAHLFGHFQPERLIGTTIRNSVGSEVALTTTPPATSSTHYSYTSQGESKTADTIGIERIRQIHPSDASYEGDEVLEKCIFEIEAAFTHPTEQYGYVMSRGLYVRLEADDMKMPVVSEGYPQYVDQKWAELNGKVEGAFTDYENARTFFFVNDEKSTRQVFKWNWDYSEMKREDERTFAALPQSDIKGIARYRDSVVFLFDNEYFEWTPKSGLNKEGRKYNKHDEPTNESGAFDAFLQGYHHNGRDDVPEKYVLLRSDVMHGGKILHTYSYFHFEEEMNLHVCADHDDH